MPSKTDQRPDEKLPKIKEPGNKKNEAPREPPPTQQDNPNTPRIVDPGPV